MSELTLERLAELRRIAEAATPGPWAVNPFRATVDEMPSMLPICGLLWPTEERTEEQTFANANYIAEFNPTTALAILGEIERLRREREVLAEAVMGWQRYLERDVGTEIVHIRTLEVHGRALALLNGEKGGGDDE